MGTGNEEQKEAGWPGAPRTQVPLTGKAVLEASGPGREAGGSLGLVQNRGHRGTKHSEGRAGRWHIGATWEALQSTDSGLTHR